MWHIKKKLIKSQEETDLQMIQICGLLDKDMKINMFKEIEENMEDFNIDS